MISEEENIIFNYGILASMAWNSNKWADNPTIQDLRKSNYEYVKDNAHMHESLNFGHDIYPAEEDNYYIGYTPMFNRLPDAENSKNVQIVFFVSSDYANENAKTIIGFYGFPEIDIWFPRTVEHELYTKYDGGNIKAHKDDIIFFKNPVIITTFNVESKILLPTGKKISKQGFNYLNSDNVYNMLLLALSRNPNSKKLKSFVSKFPSLVQLAKRGT
jgi:5-methylcytosine-specific restriction protein A